MSKYYLECEFSLYCYYHCQILQTNIRDILKPIFCGNSHITIVK